MRTAQPRLTLFETARCATGGGVDCVRLMHARLTLFETARCATSLFGEQVGPKLRLTLFETARCATT